MSTFTRRELAAALSTSAILLARPQSQPSVPATPTEEMAASQAQLRDNADQLDKFPLPMFTHPATIFRP
jgi:hypothetical protein